MHTLQGTNVGSQGELRRLNRNRVIRQIFLAKEPQSRLDIATHTGLKLPVISRITAEMLHSGLIEEHKGTAVDVLGESKRGRRQTALSLRGEGAYVVSIVISAYAQEVVLSNLKGHIVHAKSLPNIFTTDPAAIQEKMQEAITQIVEENHIPLNHLLGGGIIAPRHMLFSSPNNSTATDMTLNPVFLKKIQSNLGIPIMGARLANALNLAENRFGISQHHAHVLYLHMSMTVGCSLLQHKKLLIDSERVGFIHEMPIAHPCRCINPVARISTHASGMSILQRLTMADKDAQSLFYKVEDSLNLSIAHNKSVLGDTKAVEAFSDAGEWMGYALENLCHAYNPDVIVVAGPLARNSYYLDAMRTTWLAHRSAHGSVDMHVATLSASAAGALTTLSEHIQSEHLDLSRLLQESF